MNNTLLLATGYGVVVAQRDQAGWREIRRGLIEHHATSLIAREGVILAGTRNGVFRSDDVGRTWQAASGAFQSEGKIAPSPRPRGRCAACQSSPRTGTQSEAIICPKSETRPAASTGLTDRHVRWLAFHPDISDREFAGTEPAGIFVSHDGAQTWRECAEVAQLRDRYQWMLPYSPEAGCVRGFAFHGDRAYTAVEVGGVLRSDDAGETWRLADGSDGHPNLDGPPEPFVYPDVHSIEVHPSSPELVFAPTGGGFYQSRDGGRRWKLLYDCYCRAVWIDPLDAQHMVLGPADDVERNGRIEETRDGGATWQSASHGLPTRWAHHMVERLVQLHDELGAVLSNGELLVAPLHTLHWRRILPDVTSINAVAIFPDA